MHAEDPAYTSAPPRRGVKALARALGLVFMFLLTWLSLEVLLRAGFDALPQGTQGVIQHVRRVPWSDEHIIPVFPYETSREFQARIPPGLDDYPVHWGDAAFTFDTLRLWEGSAEGFRTQPPQWPMDLVAVGDSFAFCWTDFEDCWVEQLYARFGWHVMNLGIPGTGSMSHELVISSYAVPMEPKVVIWQWYGNDYKDDYDHARLRGEVGALAGPPPPVSDVPDYGPLADYSAVYRLLRDALDRPAEANASGEHFVTVNGREMLFNTRLDTHNLSYEMVQYGWGRTLAALDAAHAVTDGMGAELVILLVPAKEEVYATWSQDLIGSETLNYLIEGRRALLDECAARGWRCIDPTDAFTIAINDGQTVYNAFDFHLDASGNRIVADLLGNYLIAEGLLAPRTE